MILSKMDYENANKKEYLLIKNNCYSSSSLAGNTRKYHGLLVKNDYVILSAIDDYVFDKRLSCFEFSNCLDCECLKYTYSYVHPAEFHYWFSDVFVKKKIVLEDGFVSIIYSSSEPVEFKLIPLFAMREIHQTRKNFEDVSFGNMVIKSKDESAILKILASELNIERVDYIYWNVEYRRDRERGYEFRENLYAPIKIVANTDKIEVRVGDLNKNEVNIPNKLNFFNPVEMLEMACDSFLRDGYIVAGYHWFIDGWGRDTFVSIPGLLLERGKFDCAKKIFLNFARKIKDGLIPNKLKDLDYNSSDASLWFIYALKKFYEKTGDKNFIYRLKVYVEEIVEFYPNSDVAKLKGNLIYVKPKTTWMDTKYTPRDGCPVEINALWINALDFSDRLGIDIPTNVEDSIQKFKKVFWNRQYFKDLKDDESFRPNQVIALSILSDIERFPEAKNVFYMVKKKLLTPYGLRTLSPDHKEYRGKFIGDESYHNGCVWPWLLGFYIDLGLKYNIKIEPEILMPLFSHIYEAGIGFISEIFDGDAPHTPEGCIAQAWSVAEVYRAFKMLSYPLNKT